ncbi:MAG: hypothetical protein ACYC2V_10455, partial [Thiobacillus sp.]
SCRIAFSSASSSAALNERMLFSWVEAGNDGDSVALSGTLSAETRCLKGVCLKAWQFPRIY